VTHPHDHLVVLLQVVLQRITCQGQAAAAAELAHQTALGGLCILHDMRLISHNEGGTLQQSLPGQRLQQPTAQPTEPPKEKKGKYVSR